MFLEKHYLRALLRGGVVERLGSTRPHKTKQINVTMIVLKKAASASAEVAEWRRLAGWRLAGDRMESGWRLAI